MNALRSAARPLCRFAFSGWMAGVLAALAVPSLRANRLVVDLAADWRFILKDVAPNAPTDSWERVHVPHTWNAVDGQDGATPGNEARPNERGSDYYRGTGWYARSTEVPAAWKGRRIFVLFEAASQTARVFLNGRELGGHAGGFTAFCVELTDAVRFGGTNELRVQVDNSRVRTLPPLAGDFNVDGGIYRPVHLLVTEPTCITPRCSASPGVLLTIRHLDNESASVEVKTLLSNSLFTEANVSVETEILDATQSRVTTARNDITVAPSVAVHTVVQNVTISRPHRWQGRSDPYLYSARVKVMREGRVLDEVVQSLGLRTVALGTEGFLLNGKPYPVYGVCRHQDKRDQGWALRRIDDEQDVRMILDVGATAVRLAHYPQGEYFHTLSDRAGLLLWNEVPFVNEVPEPSEPPDAPSLMTRTFNEILDTEMREMILQRYNHPSAVWWGLYNELRPGAMCDAALTEVKRLNEIAHELDPSRPTVGATDKLGNPTNHVPDSTGFNVYPGWYTGEGRLGELSELIDGEYAEQQRKVALSEYGAGGNPEQHQEGELAKPEANNAPFHPEEWQTLMHERNWRQIKGNPKLWGSFLWVMFDFSSDGRREGGKPGVNDKGLVTQDRAITKDAYHFYRANWSPEPMVYLASRRATPRHQSTTEVKVYTSSDGAELLINGKSIGVEAADDFHVVRWPGVVLQSGKNVVEVRAFGPNGTVLSDRCEWELVAETVAKAAPIP